MLKPKEQSIMKLTRCTYYACLSILAILNFTAGPSEGRNISVPRQNRSLILASSSQSMTNRIKSKINNLLAANKTIMTSKKTNILNQTSNSTIKSASESCDTKKIRGKNKNACIYHKWCLRSNLENNINSSKAISNCALMTKCLSLRETSKGPERSSSKHFYLNFKIPANTTLKDKSPEGIYLVDTFDDVASDCYKHIEDTHRIRLRRHSYNYSKWAVISPGHRSIPDDSTIVGVANAFNNLMPIRKQVAKTRGWSSSYIFVNMTHPLTKKKFNIATSDWTVEIMRKFIDSFKPDVN